MTRRGRAQVILLGAKYARLSTIFALRTRYPRAWLPGHGTPITAELQRSFQAWMAADGWAARLHTNGSVCPPAACLPAEWTRPQKVGSSPWAVQVLHGVSEEEYTALILHNIVVVDLFGSSANSALLEAIALNIPVFVRPLPAVVEYLGAGYPMYFTKLDALEEAINDDGALASRLNQARAYLQEMDKSTLTIRHFGERLQELAQAVQQPPGGNGWARRKRKHFDARNRQA